MSAHRRMTLCPGVRTKRTKLPRASVKAKILVVIPPLTDLWPDFASTFCALATAVDLVDGAIDDSIFHVRII